MSDAQTIKERLLNDQEFMQLQRESKFVLMETGTPEKPIVLRMTQDVTHEDTLRVRNCLERLHPGLIQYPKPRLIKNLAPEHRDALKLYGNLRVGTLEAYRATGDAREDETEGKKQIRFEPEEPIKLWPREFDPMMPGNVGIRNGYIHIEPGGIADLGSGIPDAYIFSVSEEIIPGKFGDSYYTITDPQRFGNMLLAQLRHIDSEIVLAHLGKVVYGGMKDFLVRYRNDIEALKGYKLKEIVLPDYFLKPGSYSFEREWRYVFFTKSEINQRYFDLACDLTEVHASCEFD
jgi:hypothetical protein